MIKDSNNILKTYLADLNTRPLLTKEEEIELLTNIQMSQNEMLEKCSKSEIFKNVLLNSFKKYTPDDLDKISNKINKDSTEEDIKKLEYIFINLIDSLSSNTDNHLILENIQKFGPSSIIINQCIKTIRSINTSIYDIEVLIKKDLQYFEAETYQDLSNILDLLDKSSEERVNYSRKFNTTVIRLMNRHRDSVDNLNKFNKIIKDGICEISPLNLDDLKSIYKLINEYQYKIKKYKDELVKRNLRLVVSRAKKCLNRGLDFEDLIQEGNIGLMTAIDKHDLSRGTRVSTNATWWIDQGIKRAISNTGKTIRIPTHIEFQQSQVAKARKKLFNELQRMPDLEELSKETGYSIKKLEGYKNVAQYKTGIDDELSNGKTLLDMLSDNSNLPDKEFEKKIAIKKVKEVLSKISPRSQKVLMLRFGIGEDKDEMTLQQIADQIGLSKQSIRMIQLKALGEMLKLGDF